MKFYCTVERDPQPRFQTPELTGVWWLSDCAQYKIKRYTTRNKFGNLDYEYYAYYRLTCGNFGNHVNRSTPCYLRLKDAKQACIKHKKEIKC